MVVNCEVIQAAVVDAGSKRFFFFFSTKKSRAPAGEEYRRMIPAANVPWMYVYLSIAFLSGLDRRENRCPFSGAVLGMSSMDQL